MRYEWESAFATTYITEPNMVSRFIWAWQRKKYERIGWKVDGGIWPRLRITRPWGIEEYVLNAPSALEELMKAEFHSDGSACVDRSPASLWRTKRYEL